VDPHDNGAVRATTIEEIIAKARDILSPYRLDVKNVAWHSVYEVGHRLTDRFDDVVLNAGDRRTPRVFIAGDACHTHSAKAGQGMNVSLQDGFNLGWKLGHVLEGRSPETLLATYSAERQVVAKNLIDFDRRWSTLMAMRPEDLADPSELEEFYVRTAEFPAGFMTEYAPSMITAEATYQELAAGYGIGKRFRSAPVMRVCDGNPIHLGHHARADGRWRIYVFADADGEVVRLADWLRSDPASPLQSVPDGLDFDVWFDLKVVYQELHNDIDIASVPRVFLPETGPFRLLDYEKVYAVDPHDDIFEARGVSRAGAIVIVRPDQYVANVLPLTDTHGLAEFFQRLSLSE
jgi:phenol 2-monooxygenase